MSILCNNKQHRSAL